MPYKDPQKRLDARARFDARQRQSAQIDDYALSAIEVLTREQTAQSLGMTLREVELTEARALGKLARARHLKAYL